MARGFRVDNRGVSGVVGAVLLLGILVIALASYQAVIVPQQNAQTEFDHNQQVEDEMVELRNALLEARLDNRERATAVKLGTRYRDRTIAVNPPPATGRLDSTPEDDMIVREGGSEVIRLPDNRFIEYTPEYTEYRDAGTMRYENTVVYHAFDTANVTLSDQRLVTGDVIRLVPAAPSIDENGVDTVSYEPAPSAYRVYTAESPTITVPTDLSRSDWVELLSGQDYQSLTVSSGTLTLQLDGTKEIRYAPIDGQGDFPGDQRGDDGSDDETEINPASPNDVQLVGVERKGKTVTMTFKNSAEDTSFVDGRVSFYFGQGGNDPTNVTDVDAPNDGNNPRGEDWVIGEDFSPLSPNVELDGNGATTNLSYEFNENVQGNNDFFVTTLIFPNGDRATYFVAGEYSVDDGGTDTGTQCTVGSSNNPNTLQFDKLQDFQKNSGADKWTIGNQGVKVQDSDNDNDLAQLKFEITDSGGDVRATKTVPISGQQYENSGNLQFSPDSSYDVQSGETYTLTATVCDADGNSRTLTTSA